MAVSPASVPSETPRRPRLGAWFGTFEASLAAAGAFWLALGAGIIGGLVSAQVGASEDLVLSFRASRASAIPVAVVPTDTLLRGEPVEEIHFRFKDAKGAVHVGRSRTADTELLRKARLGVALPMRYDAAHPERARIDGTRLSPFGAFVVAPFLFAAAGLVALAAALVRSLGRRRVLTLGTLAPGRVLEVSIAQSPLRRSRVYDVRYAFEGPGGELQGISAESDAPRAGTEVAVLYDPKRPWRSLLAPDGAFAP